MAADMLVRVLVTVRRWIFVYSEVFFLMILTITRDFNGHLVVHGMFIYLPAL